MSASSMDRPPHILAGTARNTEPIYAGHSDKPTQRARIVALLRWSARVSVATLRRVVGS